MSTPEVVKLLPRNATALRKTQDSTRAPRLVAGNSVATRLESGVGNCFPGLECDLRNLERRFFPFLEIDIESQTGRMKIVAIDTAGVADSVQTGNLSPAASAVYQQIAADLAQNRSWSISEIKGTFGPL